MYTRDENYYFTLITIRVQDCIFRVPRHGFEEHSEIFRNMFSMPNVEETDEEGGSDGNPIRLDGVDKQSFKDFLLILYPPPGGLNFGYLHGRKTAGLSLNNSTHTWRSDKWLSILRLAHMWEFTEIRELAVSNLERIGLTGVQKIEITHKYDILGWYMPAYKELAKREASLSVDEASRLGIDFAIKMAGIRERWIARTSGDNSPRNRLRRRLAPETEKDPNEAQLETDIIDTFKLSPSQTNTQRNVKRHRFSL